MNISKKCKQIAEAQWFDRFIIGTILFASFLVGVNTYPVLYNANILLWETLDTLVVWIFVLEAAIKIIAEGKKPWKYFQSGWNIFDFTIVVACFLPGGGSFAAVLRLARVLRVLRLVSALPKLQMLVGALAKSLSSISYIGILLLLHFYVFGVVASLLFGGNDPIHFGNLHLSMLSLFRVVTLEDWTDIMYIQMYGSDVYQPDQFYAVQATPEAFPLLAPIFFVSFILLCTMIIMNLFIGVIMNGMSEMEKEQSALELTERRAESEIINLGDEVAHLHTMLEELSEHISKIDILANEVIPSDPDPNRPKSNKVDVVYRSVLKT